MGLSSALARPSAGGELLSPPIRGTAARGRRVAVGRWALVEAEKKLIATSRATQISGTRWILAVVDFRCDPGVKIILVNQPSKWPFL